MLSLACAGPTVPTIEEFPLPSDAPPEAMAPRGTMQVTITAVDLLTADGTPIPITAVQVERIFQFRVWTFVPRGLQQVMDLVIRGGGGERTILGLGTHPGYNALLSSLASSGNVPGLIPFVVTVYGARQIPLASRAFTLIVS